METTAVEKFNLHILPDSTPEEIEKSKRKLRETEQRIRHDYFGDVIYGIKPLDGIDKSVLDLFMQLEIGAFWRVLTHLDGYNGRDRDAADPEEKKEERRKWAKSKFSHHTLEEMLNVTVNQALLTYKEGNCPGFYIGHQILYEHLVTHKGSMFAGAVDGELERRLENGRFWEMLPSVESGGRFYGAVVDEVLTKHYEDLDLNFVKKGFKTFLRNKEGRTSFDLSLLSDEAIEKYAGFIERIYNSKILGNQEFELLVGPYICAMLSEDNDVESDCYEKLRFKHFGERLLKKFVSNSIKRSEFVKKAIVDKLCQIDPRNAREVLPYIPDTEKIFIQILKTSPHLAKEILGDKEGILSYRGSDSN